MKKILNKKDGFSLLEVIISVAILSIIAIGFGSLMSSSFSTISKNEKNIEERSKAKGDIEKEIYDLKNADVSKIGYSDQLNFDFPSLASVDSFNKQVKGGMLKFKNIEFFMPAVPSIKELTIQPSEHDLGNEPSQISFTVKTKKVPDGESITVELADQSGSVIKSSSNSIQDNEVIITTNPNLDSGLYNINLLVGEKKATIKENYIVREVRSVVVGDSGTVLTAYDVESWGFTDLNIANDLNAVSYGGPEDNKKFVAVGTNGTIVSSTNGVDWTTETVPDDVDSIDFSGVAWGNGSFIVVGEQGTIISSSFDDTTMTYDSWVERDSEYNVDLNDIVYGGTSGNQNFVVVGNGHNPSSDDRFDILHSTDGISWTADSKYTSPNPTVEFNWESITWANLETDQTTDSDKQQRKYFILVGNDKIRGLTKSLTEPNPDNQTVYLNKFDDGDPEITFNGLLAGNQSCLALGTNENDNEEGWIYNFNTLSNDWGWQDYQDVSLASETIAELNGGTYNNDDLIIIAQTVGNSARILYPTTNGEWQRADIDSTFDPSGISLNDIVTIN